jgi:hypothetical protein
LAGTAQSAAVCVLTFARPGVPRMLRSAPRLRRGALLIRGPSSNEDGSRLCGAA